ncbi:MAG: nitroreductase family protein [Pseudomonadota bacterium]
MFSKSNINHEELPVPDIQNLSDEEAAEKAKAFFDFMKTRHSIRNFSDRQVDRSIIEECIRTAGSAPSGANHQPWHFVAISNPEIKGQIRQAAEAEEGKFYAGGGGEEWLNALAPLGTDASKPHLEIAPWLIVIFAQRFGTFEDGETFKNYYVNESVGIATGFLIAALHHAGLATLTHTPNPMKFLNRLLERPQSEKPVMILATGHAASDATVPAVAKIKKPLDEILTVL